MHHNTVNLTAANASPSHPPRPQPLVPFITYTRALERGSFCICGEPAEPCGAVWIGVDADGWRPLCVSCASQTELFELIRERIRCPVAAMPGALIVINEVVHVPEQAVAVPETSSDVDATVRVQDWSG